MVNLNEKLYSTSRTFWHGGHHDTWDREKSSYKCFYVTPDFSYAALYCKNDDYSFGYMLACSFAKPLNLFDPRKAEDQAKLKAHFSKDKASAVGSFIKRLSKYDWADIMSLEKRQKFLGLLVKMGYDGFVNFEMDTGALSIGIFDFNNITVKKVYKGSEIKDYINKDSDLEMERDNEKQMYLDEDDPYPDDYALLDNEDMKELNLRKSW